MLDSSSYPSFHPFSLLDGIIAPDSDKREDWNGLSLVEKENVDEMMHDEFYESFWDYNETKS